jgi:carbon-monoxide dehydrogenase medium subunit
MSEAEAHMQGKELTESVLVEAGELAKGAVDPIDDIRGSADYKRAMVGVFLKRTVKAALSGNGSS